MRSLDTQTALAAQSPASTSTNEIVVLARQPETRQTVARRLHACLGPSLAVKTAEEIPVDGHPALVVIADADDDALVLDTACHAADAAVLWLTDRLDCRTAETVREQGGVCLEISARQPTALRQAVALATRQHRLVREHRQAVEQLNQARTDFDQLLALLSDQGGTNLTLLQNAVACLRDHQHNQPADSLASPLARVESQTKRLADWVADLVELARVGQSTRQPRWTDPAFVIDEALFDLHEWIWGRDVEVLVRRPMPALWCDADSIRQIVTPLLKNAILHGCDPQTPRVTISTELATDERGRRVTVLRVTDNGVGIDPDDREKVFRAGYRLGRSGLGTSGLGLALVRRVADQYGGTAEIETGKSPGTTVRVTLPTPDASLRLSPPTMTLPPGATRDSVFDRDGTTQPSQPTNAHLTGHPVPWDHRHRPHHRQAHRRDMAF